MLLASVLYPALILLSSSYCSCIPFTPCRHAIYKNQYRAMFVMNCHVDHTEILKYPLQSGKQKNRQTKKQQKAEGQVQSTATADSSRDSATDDTIKDVDVYHPVRCSSCTTEVGVCDAEELYHFFNVLASYS